MRALAAIDAWPAGTAAAVVATSGGEWAHGPAGTVLPWASVTKLVTALAVLVAVEEETVTLDDPAGPPGATVRHLLAHAAGLGPDGGVLARPGERRIYSNAGFEAVAAHVAERSGMAFEQYAHEAVVRPLRMTATRLDGSPAHGMAGPLADLAALARELLSSTLVTPATMSTAVTVAFPGLAGVLPGFGRQDPNDWGLGFELRDAKTPHWTGARNSPRTFGHFGRSGTFLWVDPDAGDGGTALACLTDHEFGDWAIEAWPALADAVLAELEG